ncbi:SMC-Scp complex subunit ScpB [Kribbella solani]|uniref:Segregation and condensation protein B n=1 Tax=Kribbella solani TaxID=236067 RepID=A0A841DFL2_9ACTN|nr:segregation and condensation protein B [Kribbella solani]
MTNPDPTPAPATPDEAITSDDATASDEATTAGGEEYTSSVVTSAATATPTEVRDEGEGGASASSPDTAVVGDEQSVLPVGDEVVVDDDTMRRALEAILMVTDEPLPVLTLARAVGRPVGDVADALAGLAAEYTEQGRGFDLREVGGGWRYYTRADAAMYVERFVLDGQQARLTQAALETLAVVAYKQPVSRARVSAIRGVNVDGVMRTLVARGLVEEAGADTESQATLYRTSTYFLERMGMQSLDDLPELAPYLPEMDDIEEELAAQALPEAPADTEPEQTTEQPTLTPEDSSDDAGQDTEGDVSDRGIDGDLTEPSEQDALPEPDESAEQDEAVARDELAESDELAGRDVVSERDGVRDGG